MVAPAAACYSDFARRIASLYNAEGGGSVSRADNLNRYAEGWVTGDAGVIASTLDDDYQMDDPKSE